MHIINTFFSFFMRLSLSPTFFLTQSFIPCATFSWPCRGNRSRACASPSFTHSFFEQRGQEIRCRPGHIAPWSAYIALLAERLVSPFPCITSLTAAWLSVILLSARWALCTHTFRWESPRENFSLRYILMREKCHRRLYPQCASLCE